MLGFFIFQLAQKIDLVYNFYGDGMNYNINITKEVSAPHKHKSYEVIIYINGDSCFCTQDKKTPVCTGNIIIVPPDTVHSSLSGTSPERIYINGEFNQIFNLSEPVIISDNEKKEGTLLANMIFNNRFENPDYVASLCNAFAHFLLQNIKLDDSITLALKEVINEITKNFHNPDIDLCHILNKSGYAEDYIRAQFKKQMKKTPIEFLTDIRIQHARYLIDVYGSRMTLNEIAENCGYDDYIYFSRRFKQLTGVSPRKYKSLL